MTCRGARDISRYPFYVDLKLPQICKPIMWNRLYPLRISSTIITMCFSGDKVFLCAHIYIYIIRNIFLRLHVHNDNCVSIEEKNGYAIMCVCVNIIACLLYPDLNIITATTAADIIIAHVNEDEEASSL